MALLKSPLSSLFSFSCFLFVKVSELIVHLFVKVSELIAHCLGQAGKNISNSFMSPSRYISVLSVLEFLHVKLF